MLEDMFKADVEDHMTKCIVDPLCRDIETDLRLQIHTGLMDDCEMMEKKIEKKEKEKENERQKNLPSPCISSSLFYKPPGVVKLDDRNPFRVPTIDLRHFLQASSLTH